MSGLHMTTQETGKSEWHLKIAKSNSILLKRNEYEISIKHQEPENLKGNRFLNRFIVFIWKTELHRRTEKEIEKSLIRWLWLSQPKPEPRNSVTVCRADAGAQGLCSTVFLGALEGNWIGSGAASIQTGTHIGCSIAGSSLTQYASIPAPSIINVISKLEKYW